VLPAASLFHRNIGPAAFLLAVIALPGCHRAHEGSMSTKEQARAIAKLRSAYAAFNRDDIPAAVEVLAPDIDWSEPVEFPGGGTYHGRAEVAGYLTQSRAGWAEGSSEPAQFIVHGDRIVVYVDAHFRPKDNASWTDVHLADVYTFRAGTPIAMRAFADRAEALRWVGVENH
jgi:ketosteroid isomerase-like protein